MIAAPTTLEAAQPSSLKPPLGFFVDDGRVLSAPRWRFKRTIPEIGTGTLVGQSGVGKSALAVHLAICAASGLSFFDREIKRSCGVVYYAAEGGGQIAERMRAVRLNLGIDQTLPLCWFTKSEDLADDKGFHSFMKQLSHANDWLEHAFEKPLGFVIIDTVIKAFEIEDENDNAEITRVCKRLEMISQHFNCFSLGVVHAGKDPTRGARGGSAWRDNVDIALIATGERNEIKGTCENRHLSQSKNRYGPEGPISGYDLKIVKVGVDADGDPFDATAIEPVSRGIQEKFARKLTKHRAPFEQAFKNALIDAPVRRQLCAPSGVIGATVTAVRLEQVKAEFFKICIIDVPDGKKQYDAKRMAWNRTLATLFNEFPRETDPNGVEWIWRVS